MNPPLLPGRVSLCVIFISIPFLVLHQALSQSIGINSTGAAPHASAALDVSATNKGVLVPRVALTATNTAGPVSSPATSLLVYNTATAGTSPSNVIPGYYYWDGSKWVPLITTGSGGGSFSGWALTGNAGTNSATHFLGTTDNQPLVLKVNNLNAGLITTSISGALHLGLMAGGFSSSGFANTAIGNTSLHSNTSGPFNTAIGASTLFSNQQGGLNTAVGYQALYSNNNGSNNTSLGYQTMYSNISGGSNTASGYIALNKNTTGNYNTAYGTAALYSNTTGYSNVAIGVGALYHSTSKANLVAIGDSALYNNGIDTFQNYLAIANTAVGSKALFSNTTGSYNMAIGLKSLFSNTTGVSNVGVGGSTLMNNIDGAYNTAVGNSALEYSTNGRYNTAIGYFSLVNNSTGGSNTAVGTSALLGINTGSNNTAIGDYAGPSVYSSLGNETNTGAFGYAASPTASNHIRIGNTNIVSISGNVNFSSTSDQRFKVDVQEDVKGLDFILKLRPVTYHWDIDSLNRFIYGKAADTLFARPEAQEGIAQQERITYTGFLAQEVEQAAKSVGFDFSGVVAPPNKHTPYSVRYAEFVVPLVKAVQEQQNQLGQQNELLVGLSSRIARPVVQLASAKEWADRVFEPGYRLRPLSEVEKYMQKYKHLPGIPSAQELTEKGIDVSLMLSKQMEKIEELTLYVVELEKKNKVLEKKSEKLEQLAAIVAELQKEMKEQRGVK
ncbi:tail fiber domain-containing protein [Telluribacter sp.]|jgi:hypothetical protein|uniref:tail fiber domain-containing protein n=1 Tax=Telluribacter sp. TaxID=1978767 RepID=UPI002E1611A5|nr:tail fiber domain-containing protein [Telluribacter sp.]